jgi:hypothetical protein
LAYAPVGGEVALRLPCEDRPIAAAWLDPRTGEKLPIGTVAGEIALRGPDDRDWLLDLRAQ